MPSAGRRLPWPVFKADRSWGDGQTWWEITGGLLGDVLVIEPKNE